MRKRAAYALVLVLVVMFSALPVAAQDTPTPPVQNPIYLPVVAAAGGNGATEVIEDDQMMLGEEAPEANVPKPAATQPDIIPTETGAPAEKAIEAEEVGSAEVNLTYTPLNETFEGVFPVGKWRVFDANASTGGELFWNDTTYMRSSGSWGAWAAAGGTNARNPATQNYADNMRSWMIYGPLSLDGATAATLSLNYWNNSETGWDYFGWYASRDGALFCGQRTSGYSGGWRSASLNLASVPGCGSMLGDASVWIALVFTSDGSYTYKGPFVDNVRVSMTLPEPPVAYYYNGTAFNTYRTNRLDSWPINYNWGAGSPLPGTIGTDNFSIKWIGRPRFATAGTYTFYARADDGVRIYVDGVLVVNGWYDHAPLAFSGQRAMTAGYHNVEVWYYERGYGAEVQAWWVRTSP